MAIQLFCVLLCAFQFLVSCNAADETIRPGASGSDVVLAVVGRIEDSNIFPSDNRFLRRIAYVESKDGTDSATYRNGYHGGIWQVDEVGFRATQDTTSHPGLITKFDKIQETFGINWREVQWEDLRKPLYSGLAARLFISNVPVTIPAASDIRGQGQYWKDYYNSEAGAGTVDKFVEDIEALLEKETCSINSDIFFVLDSSGSIGASNFEDVKEFCSGFVNSLKIGPNDNQVGTILFGSSASVAFYLNSYSTKASLLTAIQNIYYQDSGSTNTADGLCKLIREGYTTQHGARLSSAGVFRLAIVMTDGQSNRISSECFFRSTVQAAEAVHRFEPSILVYAIGVTDGVDNQELQAIATSSEYISTISSFNPSLFKEIQEQQTYDLCYKASVSAQIGNGLEGNLDRGESIRYQYELPADGMTIMICVRNGNVILYVSTKTRSPNSALYDHKLDVSGQSSKEECNDVYIDPSTGRKRDLSSEQANITLYVSLNGEDDYNEFFINSTVGDTSSGTLVKAQWSQLIVFPLALMLMGLV